MNRLPYVIGTVTVIVVLLVAILLFTSNDQSRSYTASRDYAGTESTFETVDHGVNSGINQSLYTSFQSKSDFEKFWMKHSQGSYPQPNVPTVDFETHMIISVFSGVKNTGGYGIEVKSVTETDSEMVIYSETSAPCPYCMVTQALTQPFHIVKVKASPKLVRYQTVKAPTPPVPYPVFILSFEDKVDADISNIVDDIEKYETVEKVEVLKSIKFLYVYFDEEKIDRCAAKEFLENQVENMDGIEYLEADPNESYWTECGKTSTSTVRSNPRGNS